MVSLIMPTLNRFDDIELFFESLLIQEYKDFEIIVVDQNECSKVMEISEKYKDKLDLKYIKSDRKGLSYNRNLGILKAKGEIIAFPDDDCTYKKETIKKAVDFFESNDEYRIYSCKTMDKNNIDAFKKMCPQNCEINAKNVFDTITSITFFVNFKKDSYLLFDEKLGVGAEFGAGEEIDYILELLSKGYRGRYFCEDVIYHPAKKHKKSKEKFQRDFNYGRGFGALCKKQIIYRKDLGFSWIFIKKIVRNIGGIILSGNRDYHIATIKGRIDGFMKYRTGDKY
ncbi:glycosyltransferase family 2 protein [Peptacetobacter hominis]|nr:glycosyltransferase family 2 protein [Peptacetobacter hominis]